MERETVRLSDHHYQLLTEGSAISEAGIMARGYRTVEDPDELKSLGFNDYQSRLVPALLIPVRDVHGELALYRIRPDEPRRDPEKPERVAKYEAPAGSAAVLDCPAFTYEKLHDLSYPLWFTEGERKADAIVSQGEACIGILGVWSWKRSGLPLPDFDATPLIGREVRVAFDSDARNNVAVRKALESLSRYLKGRIGDA